MEYSVNANNAEVSLKLMQQYFADKNINEEATVTLPKGIIQGSDLHYRYLFYSCLVNYGVKSTLLHKNLIRLYEQNPLIFSPSYICETYANDYALLTDVLRSFLNMRYPNQCAKNWFCLSDILHTQYHDNPKELFANKSSYYEFYDAVCKLKGFGQKTGGFLLRILIENDLLTPIDGIAEIPIDRHDIDLSIWLGVISNITVDEIKKSKKAIKQLSNIWVMVSNKNSISPSLTDRYLWIIGSQLCSKNKCDICPLHVECRRNKEEK